MDFTTDRMVMGLGLDLLKDENLLSGLIYPSEQNYYWSDDWSADFYTEAAWTGFITTSTEVENRVLLLPEIQKAYAVLDWENLVIESRVRNIITSGAFSKNRYFLKINTNLDPVLKKIDKYHERNWLRGRYSELLKEIASTEKNERGFKLFGMELWDGEADVLVAGEIGYTIGAVYTSLSGFCDKNNREYNGFGIFQMVFLAMLLKKRAYAFWNLGHPYMPYKFELGAKIFGRHDFLKRWFAARKKSPPKAFRESACFDCEYLKELLKDRK